MYNTLAKAWENADMVGSGPYTWNDYEQGKGMLVGRRDL